MLWESNIFFNIEIIVMNNNMLMLLSSFFSKSQIIYII